jgi:hypothetical protein
LCSGLPENYINYAEIWTLMYSRWFQFFSPSYPPTIPILTGRGFIRSSPKMGLEPDTPRAILLAVLLAATQRQVAGNEQARTDRRRKSDLIQTTLVGGSTSQRHGAFVCILYYVRQCFGWGGVGLITFLGVCTPA